MTSETLNIEKFVRESIKEKGRVKTREELQRLKNYTAKKEVYPEVVVDIIKDIGIKGLAILDKHTATKE